MKNKIRIIALITAAMLLTGCAGSGGASSQITAESAATTTETSAEIPPETSAETTAEQTTADSSQTTANSTAAPESAEQASAEIPPETTPETNIVTTAEQTSAPTELQPAESGTEENEMQEEKLIALTFDDGPNTTTTMEVLDKLEKYGIPATFFLIGNNIDEESAKSVKRAYDMGCEIENHSKTHSYMSSMTAEEVLEEYNFVDDWVFEITGEHTKFFRPPYISVSDIMTSALDAPFISGYGANDWDDRIPAERRANMILKQAKDGAIILLHDAQGNSLTVDALDIIIPELQAQNYRFVRLDELFELSGVTPQERYVYSCVYQTSVWG